MERADWTLIAICAARGKALSPVQLQKVLFLLGERQRSFVGKQYYHFIPHNYGPFDRLIYVDAKRLQDRGLIAIEEVPGQRWGEYAGTSTGMAIAEQLRADVPASVIECLDGLVGWARRCTFDELVNAVYEEFPGMRQNSIFRGAGRQRPRAVLQNTPEGDAEHQQRRRAQDVREQTLQDPDMLELLEEARRRRETGEGEWITLDELDARYPAGT